LHEKLESKERFSKWFLRMCEYGFENDIDFTSVKKSTVVNNGAFREIGDYLLKIDMAKQVCMIQKSEIGSLFRRYFIECERKLTQVSERDRALLDLFSDDKNVVAKANKKLIEIETRELNRKIEEQVVEIGGLENTIDTVGNTLLGIECETDRKNLTLMIKSLASQFAHINHLNELTCSREIYVSIYKDFCKHKDISFHELTMSRIKYSKKDPSIALKTKKTYIEAIESMGLANELLIYVKDVKVGDIVALATK
ncbi:MAG: antA/AntB antirepressor family protein, partial [Cetobacterium sp.]